MQELNTLTLRSLQKILQTCNAGVVLEHGRITALKGAQIIKPTEKEPGRGNCTGSKWTKSITPIIVDLGGKSNG